MCIIVKIKYTSMNFDFKVAYEIIKTISNYIINKNLILKALTILYQE